MWKDVNHDRSLRDDTFCTSAAHQHSATTADSLELVMSQRHFS